MSTGINALMYGIIAGTILITYKEMTKYVASVTRSIKSASESVKSISNSITNFSIFGTSKNNVKQQK